MVESVAKYLLSKGIKISPLNEWLVECYNCYSSDEALKNVSNINEFVYDQWLLADLRDIGERCIPVGTSDIQKTTLLGSYALQVDSFINVAESCYSQLQKVRGVSTVNLETEEKVTQSREPKSNRMLKLTLTDGVETVFGMEYKPISQMDNIIVPGIKVIITGPVECRRGVILLQPQHIHILGGETDNLIISNAVENVLARKLNLEENADPYSTLTLGSNTNTYDTRSNVTDPSCVSKQQTITIPEEFIDSDDDLMLCDQVEQIENNYTQESRHENEISTESSTYLASAASTFLCSANTINQNDSDNTTLVTNKKPNRNSALEVTDCILPNYHLASKRHAISPDSYKNDSSNKVPSVKKFATMSNSKQYPSSTSSLHTSTNTSHNESEILLTNCFSFGNNGTNDNTGSRQISKISDALSRSYSARKIIYFQGYIQKLTSNPRIRENSWKLTAIISDDTADIEVAFSNEFLETLFGYTSAQMVTEKSLLAKDHALRFRLEQALKQGRKRLMGAKGQIKVEFPGNNEIPVVLDIVT